MLRDSSVLDATLDAGRRQVLDRFVSVLKRRFGSRLSSIRLFGSFARGDAHPESDIDLLVLLNDEPSRADRRLVSEAATDAEVSTEAFLVLSPVVMSISAYDHLRQRERRIAQDIEREGIPV